MTAAPLRGAPGARPDPAADAGQGREWPLPFTLDVPLILSVHRRGPGDPAYATDTAGAIWRTSLTPDGPGTLRVTTRRA
ncbi:MAG TPA: hypothetical protein VGU21_01440, partial [Streptosporangiaceae bacterium]|nr:hypothetical protein [Streptosporangiaceae bacterium]